jgi:histidinol-phosphatase (PHP family)
MPFSHHSHSGQFCPGHAKNSLEEVIQTAIARKIQVFCLTEHMPRSKEDFYPEEVSTSDPALDRLQRGHTKLTALDRGQ